jgi:hypothetical protein
VAGAGCALEAGAAGAAGGAGAAGAAGAGGGVEKSTVGAFEIAASFSTLKFGLAE